MIAVGVAAALLPELLEVSSTAQRRARPPRVSYGPPCDPLPRRGAGHPRRPVRRRPAPPWRTSPMARSWSGTGSIVARGRVRRHGRSAPGRGGRRPAGRRAAAGAGRHPRALPAGPGDRRDGHAAARVAGTLRAAGGVPGWPRTRTPRRSPTSSWTAWPGPGPPPRWSSAPTSPARWTILFTAAERSRLRITAGQVLSDRLLRPELLTTPEVALAEGRKLIERWHGDGRLRYAVTPAVLAVGHAGDARRLRRADGAWRTGSGSPRT